MNAHGGVAAAHHVIPGHKRAAPIGRGSVSVHVAQHRPKPHQRSDTYLIALDMKTGRLVWDTELGDRKAGIQLTGGPVAAKGKS